MCLRASATLWGAGFCVLVSAPRAFGQECSGNGGVGNFPDVCNNFTVSPTGNAPDTLTAFSIQGVTVADDEREFLVNLGLVSTRGNHSQPTPYHDKVTLYAGIVGQVGTGDVWAFNPLVTQAPGSGDYNAQGIELDFNNANAHRGDADAGGGLAPPVSYGLSISGAAPFRSTAAMVVSGNVGMWNRGIVLANDCVAQSSFQDLGNPQKSVDIRGNPGFGVYQSSPTTQNYFAGKTGIAAPPPSMDDAAALRVGGSVAVAGSVSRTVTLESGNVEHAALLAPGAQERVMFQGIASLDEAGSVTVIVAPAPISDAYAFDGSCTYQLTALGAPMPALHVASEASLQSSGGLAFGIAGGAPRGRVSWALTAALQ